MRRATGAFKEKRLADLSALDHALEEMASRMVYEGSIEHKTHPSPVGAPRPRFDASKCPRLQSSRWPELTEALRMAVRSGCISDAIDPGGFPRYVWGRFDGQVYEARHLSSPAAGYKAYPIESFELPEGAESRMPGGAAP